MKTRSFTGNPSQILVEQLAASGVKYVFNNSGSAEARFFDALHENPDVHGILALHEGAVAGMAGGYAQASKGPAVMCVHLGAGLAQSLGQMINVWNARLPVVVITYAADSGSGNDRAGWGHHLSHNAGPTSISTPFVKAQWAVIHPDGIAHAIYRALLVAKTPPVGAVHLALYEGTLVPDDMESSIVEGGLPDVHAGYPADSDVEEIARGLSDAAHPVLYIGDGIWKSGAEQQLVAFAERYGIPLPAAAISGCALFRRTTSCIVKIAGHWIRITSLPSVFATRGVITSSQRRRRLLPSVPTLTISRIWRVLTWLCWQMKDGHWRNLTSA